MNNENHDPGILALTINPVQLSGCVQVLYRWMHSSSGNGQVFCIIVERDNTLHWHFSTIGMRGSVPLLTVKLYRGKVGNKTIKKAVVQDTWYWLFKDELDAVLRENGLIMEPLNQVKPSIIFNDW